jgi:hypothetical protein
VKGGMDVVHGVGENGAVMTWAGVEWLPYLGEPVRSDSDSGAGIPKTVDFSR